ncbi:MAG TPA: glycosyltransferase family 4 protein [Mucilaginibacter sp.]|nr:glycosyltransferase family 4 protein [Mucilaginibacter sp.]
MKRLAIVTTHPIQYYAPVFELLHKRQKIDIRVFYTWGEQANSKFDPGFGKSVDWDIPLLNGYPYTWVKNISTNPGSSHYKGIVNPELIGEITNWRADAVLVYGWAYHSHLNVMRHFHGKIPVYFRGDSTLLNTAFGIKGLVKYFYLQAVYRNIDYAFYVGSNNKAYFRKYGLKENQLIFAPHAIDNDRFGENREIEAKQIRSSLGVSEKDILILYAGKFEAVKNTELLISAFIDLKKTGVHLLLAGNGAKESILKHMAQKSQLTTNIHFLNFQNQTYMPVLYQAADVFCLPSLSETWGLSVNEAMACGKAVLVSDKVGCAADLVKENYNGYTFRSSEMCDLVKKLDKITGSKEELINYGSNSKALIKNWNFLAFAETIEKKINEVNE